MEGLRPCRQRIEMLGNEDRTNRGPPPKLGDFSHASILQRMFLSELWFECFWFNQALGEMLKLRDEGDSAVEAEPIINNLRIWSYVDRMLTHVVRIDRLVNPRTGAREEDPKSLEWRKGFADWLRERVSSDLFIDRDTRKVRDVAEHSNEYLYAFLTRHLGQKIGPFGIGVDVSKTPEAGAAFIRVFDQTSGYCSVYGKGPMYLRSIHDKINDLIKQLPDPRETFLGTELWKGGAKYRVVPPTGKGSSVDL